MGVSQQRYIQAKRFLIYVTALRGKQISRIHVYFIFAKNKTWNPNKLVVLSQNAQ